MICYQVIGCDTTIAHATAAAQLELNDDAGDCL